jgi:hypothetical protein
MWSRSGANPLLSHVARAIEGAAEPWRITVRNWQLSAGIDPDQFAAATVARKWIEKLVSADVGS